MTDTTLTEAKQFLRITHNLDDNYITSLITMAKQFIAEQTGVSYSSTDAVYNMAVLQSVAHFYDKRESISEKSQIVVPYTLDCLIKHISIRGVINE